MKLLSSKRGASARFTAGLRRNWLAHVLLIVTIVMAVAASLALNITQREMTSLSSPNQHNDLWVAVSIARELQQLEYAAGLCLERGNSANCDDLSTRLDVLQSLLCPDVNAPSVSTDVISKIPDAQEIIADINRQVNAWSLELGSETNAASVSRQIIAHERVFSRQINQVVLSVHLGTTQILDQERIKLYQRFSLINWTLLALLSCMALLVLKLFKDRHLLKRLSNHLKVLNSSLERRVKRRTRQLAESKSLLIFILDASPNEVTLANADTGEVYFINRRLLERLSRDKIDTLFIHELLANEDERTRFMDELDQFGRVDNWEAQIASSIPYWSSLSVKLVEIEGELSHLLWGHDISKHKDLLAALEIQASTDPMTGLYNRRAFYERSTHVLEACKRYKHPYSVMMLDIDHFKRINDLHGHAVGDEALCSISRILRTELREVDIIGRMGGEEFAVVMPHTDMLQALETAERLRYTIAETVHSCHGVHLELTVSVGLAFLSQVSSTLESLLDTADKALYEAKNTGRNRVHS